MTFVRLALSGLAVLVPVAYAGGTLAQDQGGRSLFADVYQRLEGTTNLGLDPDEQGAYVATTGLSLGISSITARDSLTLSLGGTLRATNDDEADSGFEGPRLRGDYARSGANASFRFSTTYDSRDIEYFDALDLAGTLEEGGLVPTDLDEISSFLDGFNRTGTRDTFRFDTALSLGTAGPLGVTFGLSGRDSSYSGLSPTSTLDDSTSLRADVTARARVNPVLDATASLRFRHAEEGDSTEDTTGVGVGLLYERPIGTYGVSFDADEVDGETRFGLSGSLARSFPRNADLDLTLGIVSTTSDEVTWNGALSYSQPLSRVSAANVQFRRAVTDDPDQGEKTVSIFAAGYDRSLTRLTSVGLDATFTRTENLSSDRSETAGRVSASVSRRLTENWALTGGVSHAFENQDLGGDTTANTVFVQIGRSFLTKF